MREGGGGGERVRVREHTWLVAMKTTEATSCYQDTLHDSSVVFMATSHVCSLTLTLSPPPPPSLIRHGLQL